MHVSARVRSGNPRGGRDALTPAIHATFTYVGVDIDGDGMPFTVQGVGSVPLDGGPQHGGGVAAGEAATMEQAVATIKKRLG